MRLSRSACLFVLAGCLFEAQGSEVVHLRSGFDLQADSHTSAEHTYSFATATGTIELPTSEVLSIERIPTALKPAAPLASPPSPDLASLIRSIAVSVANTPEFSRLVRSVADVESHMQQDARSSKGAGGIMQLMPQTARELGVDIRDSVGNVTGGTRYLRQLLMEYHNDAVLALAAYNAGPGAVQKYGGVPPFSETRTYIRRVLREYSELEHSEAQPK